MLSPMLLALLAWFPGDDEVGKLMMQLRAEDSLTRIKAVERMAELGAKAERALPALVHRVVHDDHPTVVFKSLHALIEMGEAAVPVLAKELRAAVKPEIRARFVYVLGEIGPPARDSVPEM